MKDEIIKFTDILFPKKITNKKGKNNYGNIV